MNNEVDKYLSRLDKWHEELSELRAIILDCGLAEDYKWMHPSYSDNGKNIVLIHEFKDYCAILFQKGALLKDAENILVQQTKNTQSARQIRFTELSEISRLKPVIKKYIIEAIKLEKSELKVPMKNTSDYELPDELKQIFEKIPDFEKAFKKLSDGRQRGYLLHFTKPKQSQTKTSRIENCMKRIFEGYGLTDCTCGLSKRKPNCDGSHKQLEINE
jgi:uncharacterized protein YdeI (YjbR/CyaY-like superfamily)